MIWEDHFYPEIIDPVSGEVLPDGERGELVFTSLTKEAFPIIRYRTRDLTRLLPGTARTMRRMEKITGRSDDMLIIRGVNLFPTQIEELILEEERLSPHYLLELARTARWTRSRSSSKQEPMPPTRRRGRQRQLRSCSSHIKSRIGISSDGRRGSAGRESSAPAARRNAFGICDDIVIGEERNDHERRRHQRICRARRRHRLRNACRQRRDRAPPRPSSWTASASASPAVPDPGLMV